MPCHALRFLGYILQLQGSAMISMPCIAKPGQLWASMLPDAASLMRAALRIVKRLHMPPA